MSDALETYKEMLLHLRRAESGLMLFLALHPDVKLKPTKDIKTKDEMLAKLRLAIRMVEDRIHDRGN